MTRALLGLSLFVVSCHSAGQYGYSRTYEPLSPESVAAKDARDYDPVMAAREHADWKTKPVTVFGIVKSRSQAKDGSTYVALSVRTLSGRNLCDSMDEDTCRVTVSEHEHAVVHAKLQLTSEDDIGKSSVGPGSLLRVIGKLSDDVDVDDGTAIIQASYYRHWPRNFFVTTADRAHMQM
ncbi:MAG TPA: hypothetical protein VGM29_01830 [Polyangiaceae bacterium]|jgi:hypothetical protein